MVLHMIGQMARLNLIQLCIRYELKLYDKLCEHLKDAVKQSQFSLKIAQQLNYLPDRHLIKLAG